MPLVLLEPGKSLNLPSGNDDYAVSNPTTQAGQYTLSFNAFPLSIQMHILPHAYHPFGMPDKGGTIGNNGDVSLVVTTPGL